MTASVTRPCRHCKQPTVFTGARLKWKLWVCNACRAEKRAQERGGRVRSVGADGIQILSYRGCQGIVDHLAEDRRSTRVTFALDRFEKIDALARAQNIPFTAAVRLLVDRALQQGA
jgi:hypothetical protein